MTARYRWLAAPVWGHYEHGKRWRLQLGDRVVGRVVQLLPGGLWEAHAGAGWYAPAYDSLEAAAVALWAHVNPPSSP